MDSQKQITLGSLFDGIGGFPYAGSFFGIAPVWASEILPQAVSVTMRHFPEMEHVGDLTKLNGAELPPVDIITFGSPCQDLSTAGKRAGIGGERSSLFYEAIRIIDEMRDATNGEYPKYAVWENVPGALSSGNPRGSDFRAVLEAFTKTEVPVPCSNEWANTGMVRSNGINLAWAVKNAQYHGVPQRRRRIFLVASFGAGRADEILFIEEGLRRYLTPRCQAGQGITANVEGCAGGAMRGGCLTPWDVQSRRIHDEDGSWPALYGEQGGGHGYAATLQKPDRGVKCLNPWETQQSRVFTEDGASPTMAGADGGGGRNPAGLVCAAFLGGASAKARSIGYSEDVSPTLKAVACGFSSPCLCEPQEQTEPVDSAAVYGLCADSSNCMKSSNPHSGIYEADTSRTLDRNGGNPGCNQGGMLIVEPHTKYGSNQTALVLNDQGGDSLTVEKQDISPTLRSQTHGNLPIIAGCLDSAVGVHQNQAGEVSVSKMAYTLATTSNASSRNAPLVAHRNPNDIETAELRAAGLTSKGNGDCFLTLDCHGALSQGGGQAGQGYPAALVPITGVHPDISGTLCASGAGLSRPAGMASETDFCVTYERPAYALQGNMIGRQDHNGPLGSGINEDVSFTITATDVGGIAAKHRQSEPIPINDRATRHRGGGDTRNGDGCGNGLGVGKPGDPSPTLSTGDKHAVATVFNRQRNDMFKEADLAGTQTARQCKDATDLVCEGSLTTDVSAVDCRNFKEIGDMSGTLQAKDKPGYSLNYQNPVRSGYIVRRLTPTECERLQGFVDGWTAYGHDGKEISDTRRYQMLGNSVAIPCVAFVLGGIAAQMRREFV